jgi:hypothetical protein
LELDAPVVARQYLIAALPGEGSPAGAVLRHANRVAVTRPPHPDCGALARRPCKPLYTAPERHFATLTRPDAGVQAVARRAPFGVL